MSFESKTVLELKAIAKNKNLKYSDYGHLRKAELIKLVRSPQNKSPKSSSSKNKSPRNSSPKKTTNKSCTDSIARMANDLYRNFYVFCLLEILNAPSEFNLNRLTKEFTRFKTKTAGVDNPGNFKGFLNMKRLEQTSSELKVLKDALSKFKSGKMKLLSYRRKLYGIAKGWGFFKDPIYDGIVAANIVGSFM